MGEGMGPGILSGRIEDHRRATGPPRRVKAEPGMVVTHMATRFTGTVAGFGPAGVTLRSRDGSVKRQFAVRTGDFMVAGAVVTLVPPAGATSSGQEPARRTASGSLAVPGARARAARASRILVEGVHDAELVEKVWGDDLRVDGIVVERLDGLDNLADLLAVLRPGPDARLGVLVDHLVPGSKESRVAGQLAGPYVHILGTPFVDVWQAVRPRALGIDAWPVVPPGRPWKEGICEALGEPSPPVFWKKLLSCARTYADLEPALVGAVEALIDFVTAVPERP
jgi:hypothetical protein